MERHLFLSILLIGGRLAGVESSGYQYCTDSGKPLACPEHSKLRYEPKTAYTYQYRFEIETNLPATFPNDVSTIGFNAEAMITVSDLPCYMSVKFANVKLKGQKTDAEEDNPTVEELKRDLETWSVHFEIMDGRITRVCKQTDDSAWSVNIKLGVVSMLQNTMKNIDVSESTHDNDVSGTCHVMYQVAQPGLIEKLKSLTTCIQNKQTLEPPLNSPIMTAWQRCRQLIHNGIFTSISCDELFVAKLPLNQELPLQTKIVAVLHYDDSTLVDAPDNSLPLDAAMDLSYQLTATNDSVEALGYLYLQLCEGNEVIDTPAKFADVISKLRRLNQKEVTTLRNTLVSARDCTKGLNTFDSLLLAAGTENAIEALLESQNGVDSKIYMKFFASVGKPTLSMLRKFKLMLEDNRIDLTAQDIVDGCSMIHKHHRFVDGTACELSEVQTIRSMLESRLHNDCGSESEDAIISTLKAIENMGCGSPSLLRVLENCYVNRRVSLDVKLATIDAFRLADCQFIEMSYLLQVLQDQKANTQLRIQAYLILMQCSLVTDNVDKLKDLLERETDRHLGSFILSHLSKAMLRDRTMVTQILTNEIITSKFVEGLGGLSYFDTTTYDATLLNVKIIVESQVIWSELSNMPQSITCRRVLVSLGEPVHVVELSLSSHQLGEWLDSNIASYKNLMNSIFDQYGGKRKDFKPPQVPRALSENVGDSNPLNVRYAMRVQHRDTGFGVYQLHMVNSAEELFGKLIQRILDGFQYGFEQIDILHEKHIEQPTVTGLPLLFDVNNIAIFNASVQSDYNIIPLIGINGTVKYRSSASLGLDVAMSVDLQHTSASARAALLAKHEIDEIVANAAMSSLNISMHKSARLPDEMILLDYSMRFFLVQDGIEVDMTSFDGGVQPTCKYNAIFNAIALEYCELNSLTGGLTTGGIVKMYIKKRGEYDIQRFKIEAVRTQNRTKTRISYITVPATNQHFELMYANGGPQSEFLAESSIKYGAYTVTGSFDGRDDLWTIIGGNTSFELTSNLKREKFAHVVQYKASVLCQVAGHSINIFEGDMKIQKEGETVESHTMHTESLITHLKSTAIGDKGGQVDISASYNSPAQRANISARFLLAKNQSGFIHESRVHAEHIPVAGSKQHIGVRYSQDLDRVHNKLVSVILNAGYDTSLSAQYGKGNFYYAARWDDKHSVSHLDTGFDDYRRIKETKKSQYQLEDPNNFKLSGTSEHIMPFLDIFDCKGTMNASYVNAIAKLDMISDCGPRSFSMHATLQPDQRYSLTGTIRILYPRLPLSTKSEQVLIHITDVRDYTSKTEKIEAHTTAGSIAAIHAWATSDALSDRGRFLFCWRNTQGTAELTQLQQDRAVTNGHFKTATQVDRLMSSQLPDPVAAIVDALFEDHRVRWRMLVDVATQPNTALNVTFSAERRNITSSVSLRSVILPFENMTLAFSTHAYGNRFDISALARGLWSSCPSVLDVGLERIDKGWLIHYAGEPLFVSPVIEQRHPIK